MTYMDTYANINKGCFSSNLLCKVLLVLSVFVRVGLVCEVGVDCALFFFCGG